MSSRRDIEVPWTCKRDGRCCETTGEVRMTHQERQALEDAAPTSAVLAWRSDPDPRFTRLVAKPCPLLQRDADGKAMCSVWEVRPLMCRMFLCGRVDVQKEPYEPEPVNWVLGLTGCGNLTARLNESTRFRAHYLTNARCEKREWGKAHGW